MSDMVCMTHYEMLENHIAELEYENARLRETIDHLKKLLQQHQTYSPKETLK